MYVGDTFIPVYVYLGYVRYSYITGSTHTRAKRMLFFSESIPSVSWHQLEKAIFLLFSWTSTNFWIWCILYCVRAHSVAVLRQWEQSGRCTLVEDSCPNSTKDELPEAGNKHGPSLVLCCHKRCCKVISLYSAVESWESRVSETCAQLKQMLLMKSHHLLLFPAFYRRLEKIMLVCHK